MCCSACRNARKGRAIEAVLRRFVDSGLFALCRHPNYFGEILIWVSITALAGTQGVFRAHPWIIASPLFTAFLLLYVSGARPVLTLGFDRVHCLPSALHVGCTPSLNPRVFQDSLLSSCCMC
jgi:hypothetical protein